ncbi:hypothetical protein T484DRAFT_1753474 [Baffinella frigidus]|nr:hypothetical protein T484DRAFT_1753474 [Cryptophyta sp. CCMP2293]
MPAFTTTCKQRYDALVHFSERRNWRTVAAMEPYLWDDVETIASCATDRIRETDELNFITYPEKLQQDRWLSVAVTEHVIHLHSFAQRMKFSAIGSSATLEVVLKALYTRVDLLGRIPNYRDQGILICQLATLLLDTTKVPYYQEAKRLFNKALRIAEDNGFYSIESASNAGLGRIACLEDDIPEALRLLNHAVAVAKESEIAVHALETNAVYELAVALGNSKDDTDKEELLDACARLGALNEIAFGMVGGWRIADTIIDYSSPITARECLDPWVRPSDMSTHTKAQARLTFVMILLAERRKRYTDVDSHVDTLCEGLVCNLHVLDPCARDSYDLLRRFRAIVLRWSESETKDKTIAVIAATMLTLLTHMTKQKREYEELLDVFHELEV